MKTPIKHLLSGVLALAMLLAICLPVSAADQSVVVAANTVTLKSETSGEKEEISFTPDSDGIMTVSMAAADPGWAFRVEYPDGSGTLLIHKMDAMAYEYEVTAGSTYKILLYSYNQAGWSFGDGEISYEISFLPAELNQEQVTVEYLVSDTTLALGENVLTAEPNAVTTIFAFTPDETGTYQFTATDSSAKVGYWGSTANYLQNPGDQLTNTLEHTITAVGQSVMLGISGVESCTLTVVKTADYQETTIQTIVYESNHVFGTYTYDENAVVDIDIFDSEADVAVLGEDGFYHYGSAGGPVMVVNLKTIPIDINGAYTHGQLTSYVTDENGVTVKYDYNEVMFAYYKQGLYPVTEELAMMLQQVGQTRSWYEPGGFVYPDAETVDQDIAWMGICSYVTGTESFTMPTLTLQYPTLAFEDEILYNVYYTVDDATSIVEMGLITFSERNEAGTIDDALEVISGFVANANGSYTVSSNGIPAKQLGDALYFKVYAKLSDGSYVYSNVAGYHAVLYANSVLNNASSSEKAKTLVVAMLNYGTAAQLQFNYRTDSLINAGLTAEQLALVETYSESMVQSVVKANPAKASYFEANGGYSSIIPSVSFEGAFAVNYYFTPSATPDDGITFYYWTTDTYNSYSVLTPANADDTIKLTGDSYIGMVEGIAAKQLDETMYVAAIYTSGGTTYYSPVVSYSLGAYCKNIAANGSDIGAATAVYGYYAKAYFAS